MGFRGLASWAVDYRDGGFLSQYDAEGNEVPYKAVEWSRVSRLVLESQLLRQTWDITPTPDVLLSLRSRHFMKSDGTATMCFILLGSEPGKEIDAESTAWALYWFPDGTVHDCDLFDCPEVRAYGSGLIHGIQRSIMPGHHEDEVKADAVID